MRSGTENVPAMSQDYGLAPKMIYDNQNEKIEKAL